MQDTISAPHECLPLYPREAREASFQLPAETQGMPCGGQGRPGSVRTLAAQGTTAAWSGRCRALESRAVIHSLEPQIRSLPLCSKHTTLNLRDALHKIGGEKDYSENIYCDLMTVKLWF